MVRARVKKIKYLSEEITRNYREENSKDVWPFVTRGMLVIFSRVASSFESGQ